MRVSEYVTDAPARLAQVFEFGGERDAIQYSSSGILAITVNTDDSKARSMTPIGPLAIVLSARMPNHAFPSTAPCPR